MWAIGDGTEAMVAILLEAGAEPNRFYGRGSALYAAIENNRQITNSILLKHGVDPLATIPDPWEPPEYAGLTLIEFAKRMKRPKLVSILAGKPIPVSSAKLVLLPLMWRQIAKKLQVLNVDPKDVLNPATNEVAIQAFESQLGSPLPAAVKKSWMIHDCQPPEVACFRIRNGVVEEFAEDANLFRLIPISEMFAELRLAAESYASVVGETGRFQAESGIASVAWATSWLPLARNLAGDLLCCDLAPTQGGTVGQIILASSENPVRTRIANNWCECLENLAVCLVEDDE